MSWFLWNLFDIFHDFWKHSKSWSPNESWERVAGEYRVSQHKPWPCRLWIVPRLKCAPCSRPAWSVLPQRATEFHYFARPYSVRPRIPNNTGILYRSGSEKGARCQAKRIWPEHLGTIANDCNWSLIQEKSLTFRHFDSIDWWMPMDFLVSFYFLVISTLCLLSKPCFPLQSALKSKKSPPAGNF